MQAERANITDLNPGARDWSGRRVGKLRVLYPTTHVYQGHRYWMTICDCGKQKLVRGNLFNGNKQRSCGCTKSVGLVKARAAAEEKRRGRPEFDRTPPLKPCPICQVKLVRRVKMAATEQWRILEPDSDGNIRVLIDRGYEDEGGGNHSIHGCKR